MQTPEQSRTFTIGNVDCICILVDKMELLRHRPEWKFTALDTMRKRFDDTLLVQRIAGQTAQAVEIPCHRLRCGRVTIVAQCFSGCADGGSKQQRRQLRPLKNCDKAPLHRMFSLTVAATRRLHDGIQPRQLPVYGREIYINTRFNQRGGYHTARFALSEPFSDLPEQRLTLCRDHQGR